MVDVIKITDRGIVPVREPRKLVDSKSIILRQSIPPFDFNTRYDAIDIANQLIEVLQSSNGLALAAPQAGIVANVFVMGREDQIVACFNPKILVRSEEKLKLEEGCLSFPQLYFKIERPRRIMVEYQDYEGKTHKNEFDGLTARIFQHEIDHLDGILYTDYVGDVAMHMAKKKQMKLLRNVKS